MSPDQRRVVAVAAYVVAGILFVVYFGGPFWQWLTWDRSRGTLDLGILKVTTRPPFPSDAKGVIAGLVLPVMLAAFGRVFERTPRA